MAGQVVCPPHLRYTPTQPTPADPPAGVVAAAPYSGQARDMPVGGYGWVMQNAVYRDPADALWLSGTCIVVDRPVDPYRPVRVERLADGWRVEWPAGERINAEQPSWPLDAWVVEFVETEGGDA